MHDKTEPTLYSIYFVDLQVLDKDHTRVPDPAVGEFYAGQYVDGSWYRCRVDACEPDQRVTVTYIDYGNRETVSCDKIRNLKSEWCTLAGQVGSKFCFKF